MIYNQRHYIDTEDEKERIDSTCYDPLFKAVVYAIMSSLSIKDGYIDVGEISVEKRFSM